MAEQLFYVGAYDGGGENGRVAVAKSDGTIVGRANRHIKGLPGKDLPQVIGDCLKEAIRTASEAEKTGIRLVAFAGSQAGTIDRDNGIIIFSPNLVEARNIEFMKYLQGRYDIPCWLENDADMAAYGVLKLDPQAKGMKHLLYIVRGTGTGGGIIINGEVYSGVGAGGEIGHMKMMPDGTICGCGGDTCWEAKTGGRGIENRLKTEPGANAIRDALGVEGPLTAKHLFEAYAKGVPYALQFVDDVVTIDSIHIANLINVLRPEAIFVGESVAVNNPQLIEMYRAKVPPRVMPGVKDTKILLTQVQDPGLYGAIYCAIDRYQRVDISR